MAETPSTFGAHESKPAPMPLRLVQGFLNTVDLEEGTDLLADPKSARDWLLAARLVDRHVRLTPPELERAREVRESLRRLLERDGGDRREAQERLAPLRALAAGHRAQLAVAPDGVVGLENAHRGGLEDALFELLLIVHGAQQDGTWERLKVCGNPECRWAFYDRSRNHQGSWCDMSTCGNRLKNRQLRARRRS